MCNMIGKIMDDMVRMDAMDEETNNAHANLSIRSISSIDWGVRAPPEKERPPPRCKGRRRRWDYEGTRLGRVLRVKLTGHDNPGGRVHNETHGHVFRLEGAVCDFESTNSRQIPRRDE